MAVRREQVILDLTDNVTPGLARMAVAAGVADRALKSMGGTSVSSSQDLDKVGVSSKKVGDSAGRAGPAIDKFSDRLRLLTDVAVTLGPALIPLGASTIPVLSAALVGLGAAAGSVGVAIAAFQGVGDGLKALDAYNLEPTVENLQKLQAAQAELGESGTVFVNYLHSLGPEMANLQQIARDGLFPGVEEGIDDLLGRLPLVEQVVNRLSREMGKLAEDAGQSLAGDKWTPFFDYVRTDAAPTLDAFARSTGNVALGLANMLVAFAPVSRDFTGGLEDMTKRFAEWSAGLGENQSFQEFLAYVRQSGPQAVELLGAIAEAFAGLATAAAPVGSVVLPAISGLAKAFAAIAKSPIGPPLYAAAAGMIAFNRAAKMATGVSTKIEASLSRIGIEAATTQQKLAVLGTGGAAAALGLGTLIDVFNEMDSRSRSGEAANATVKSIQDLQDALQYSNVGKYADDLHINLGRLAEDLAKNGAQGEYAARVLDQLGQSSHGAGALLSAEVGHILPFYTDGTSKATDANKDLKNIIDAMGGSLSEEGGLLHGIAVAASAAAASAGDLTTALANLNGWFDKRDAVIAYKDAVLELARGLKDGFNREDLGNLNALGKSILQVASSMAPGQQRDNFLAGARQQLEDLASKAGPDAAAAIEKVIGKLDSEGLTHPKPITLTVEQKRAEEAFAKTRRSMADLDSAKANPEITADDKATHTINGVKFLLRSLDGDTATTYVKTIHTTQTRPGTSVVEPHAAVGNADGGTVPRSGRGYVDRYHYLLADGEEVISNRRGQADRHRALLKKINAGLADGGTAGNSLFDTGRPGDNLHGTFFGQGSVFAPLNQLGPAATSAAEGLKGLKKQLDQQQKAYDKAKSARDGAVSRRDSISGSIQQGLMGGSLWDTSEASKNPWAAGATAGGVANPTAAANARADRARRLVAAINKLKSEGVTGPALLEIIGDGDVERAEMMAALPIADLANFSSAVNDSNAALAAAGLAGGNAIEGDNIRTTNRRLDRLHDDLQEVKHAVNQAEKANDRAQERNADKVTAGVNGAASSGHKRGK